MYATANPIYLYLVGQGIDYGRTNGNCGRKPDAHHRKQFHGGRLCKHTDGRKIVAIVEIISGVCFYHQFIGIVGRDYLFVYFVMFFFGYDVVGTSGLCNEYDGF